MSCLSSEVYSINLADLFTKQLGATLFYRHLDYIHGHVPPHYILPTHNNTDNTKEIDNVDSVAIKTARVWANIAHNPFGFTNAPVY